MNNTTNKKQSPISLSIFLLGCVTSLQLFTIGGVTLFNILLLTTVLLVFFFCEIIKVDYYFFFATFISLITIAISFILTDLTTGFKKAAFVTGIIYIIILLLYSVMNKNVFLATRFIAGFDYSCKLVLYWCLLQVIFFYVANVDINVVLFNGLFGITGKVSDYIDGVLIPTGFFYHRAIIIPVLIYLYFKTNRFYEKVIIILIAILSKSTAVILGLALCIFLEVIEKIIYTYKSKKVSTSVNKLILIAIALVCTLIGVIFLFPYINRIIAYVISRIVETGSTKAGSSSVTHFMYYKNLFTVLSREDLVHILFGNGFSTSGYSYVLLNGQYKELSSWVVESDYINILLSQGVLGLTLWLFFLIRIIFVSIKKKMNIKHIFFMLVILFIGVLYNIQFNWFILFIMALYILLKHDIEVFE